MLRLKAYGNLGGHVHSRPDAVKATGTLETTPQRGLKGAFLTVVVPVLWAEKKTLQLIRVVLLGKGQILSMTLHNCSQQN